MNKLVFFFLYTLGIIFFLPQVAPNLNLFYFAPFLIISFYSQSKIKCLWLSLLCGLIIDLLSAQTRFGTYAVNYALTSWILYGQKQNYYEDSPTTFPIMTFFFVFISTSIHAFSMFLLGPRFVLKWQWIQNNLIVMPAYDAVYAGVAFTFLYLFFPKSSKKQRVLFSTRSE